MPTIVRSLPCNLSSYGPYSPPIEGNKWDDMTHELAATAASTTRSVDEELRLRNAYLVTENRILRQQIMGRVPLSDGDRLALAELGQKLGRKTLKEIATVAKPDTILAWHRKRSEQKGDCSQFSPCALPDCRADLFQDMDKVVLLPVVARHPIRDGPRQNRPWLGELPQDDDRMAA
ncbi:MAG TPA: hypothetical protein VI542_06450 [Candidatus Tectomicrobia bacterium]